MAKSLKKNAIYQTLYQIIATITPLITSPYLSRTLGADNLGIFSYSLSIVNYFMLFTLLGVQNYGSRTIASVQDDNKKLEESFNAIYQLQFACGLICTFIYFGSILLINPENKFIYEIQGMWILSSLFDVTWFFWGKEDFKVTVIRNTIIKVITVISILLFVKGNNALILYCVIMAGGTLLSQLTIWPVLFKSVKFQRVRKDIFLEHLKPNILLFGPVLAMSVYHLLDKTMLGYLSTYNEVGYYYNTDKIINIPLGIFSGLNLVFLPRISKMKSDRNISGVKNLMAQSFETDICLAFAIAFGIAAVSKEFVPVFFGIGYEPCVNMLWIFAPILIIKVVTGYISSEYIIPFHLENKYTFSIIFGAIVDIIANMLLIPKLGATGAIIGTFLAELTVMILVVVFLFSKYENRPENMINIMCVYIFPAIIMCVVVRCVSLLPVDFRILLIIEIIVGGLTYFCSSVIIWRFYDKSLIGIEIRSLLNKWNRIKH